MTFPTGPPSYEATMSATMSVNPAFVDENSIISGDIPPDDDLPPPYESIANETFRSQEGISQNITNAEGQPAEQIQNQSAISASNSENTESMVHVNSSIDAPSSSSSSTSPEPFYEPSPAIDDEGRYM